MSFENITDAQIVAELIHRKNTDPLSFYEPMPMQSQFRNDSAKTKCLFGGNRSGKTQEGAAYVLRKLLSKSSRWWACAETFNDSVNIQQKKISELIPANRIIYGMYSDVNGYTNRKLIVKSDDGGQSILEFKSYDQTRLAFQGDAIDGCWDDEEPPTDIYKEQRMRLIDRDGEMILTMTSLKGMTDLLLTLFEGYKIIKSQYAPMVNEVLPRIAENNGIKFYFLWTEENKYIDYERMMSDSKVMSNQEKKSRFYGMPINIAGRVYPMYNSDVHLIDFDDVPKKNVTLYAVLDPHDRKPWAMSWWVCHSTGTLYCIDEYPDRDFNDMLSDDKTYDDYAVMIKEREDILKKIFHKGVYRYIIDPNFGNKTIQLSERQSGQSKTTPVMELRKRGLVFHDAVDDIQSGHLAVKQRLHWEKKGDEIIKQPSLFICKTCINTDKHLSLYGRKDPTTKDGDVKDMSPLLEKYKDFSDLVRYLVMSNPRHIVPYINDYEQERMY